MGGPGVWDASRARKANRRWVFVAAAMSVFMAVILSAGAWLPYVWTSAMWRSQKAEAHTVAYEIADPGTPYGDVVAELGPVSYESPGFSHDGEVTAAVCVWQNTDAGEVRGMFINGRLTGSLLVFE